MYQKKSYIEYIYLGVEQVRVKVKVVQWCLILCNPMDYTAHGIFQARILEWVALPAPGDLPNPGIKPRSPTLQAPFKLQLASPFAPKWAGCPSFVT